LVEDIGCALSGDAIYGGAEGGHKQRSVIQRDAIAELVASQTVARLELLSSLQIPARLGEDVGGAAKAGIAVGTDDRGRRLIAAAEPKKVLVIPSLAVTFCSVKPAGPAEAWPVSVCCAETLAIDTGLRKEYRGEKSEERNDERSRTKVWNVDFFFMCGLFHDGF
jgi:hypothetical protein